MEPLERGREAYARANWPEAFRRFEEADRESALGCADLWRLAVASHLLGRRARYAEALERACASHQRDGAYADAAWCAFWLGFDLVDHGEGMSVAALEAERLAEVVDRVRPERVASSFYRAVRPIVDDAWAQAVGNDLLHPGVEGPRSVQWRLTNAYMGRLLPAAHRDPVVGRTFLETMGMLTPATSLLRPGVVTRVLFGGGRRKGAPTPASALDSPPKWRV